MIIIIVIFIIYKVRNVEHFYFLSSPSPSGSVPMCTEKFIVDVPAGFGQIYRNGRLSSGQDVKVYMRDSKKRFWAFSDSPDGNDKVIGLVINADGVFQRYTDIEIKKNWSHFYDKVGVDNYTTMDGIVNRTISDPGFNNTWNKFNFKKGDNYSNLSCQFPFVKMVDFTSSCPQKNRLNTVKDILGNSLASGETCDTLKSKYGCDSVFKYKPIDIGLEKCLNSFNPNRLGKPVDNQCDDKLLSYFCQKTCKSCDKKMAIVGEYVFFNWWSW